MSGGAGLCVESAGGVSRPKMCIWRSGGPKSMGKHIVPESAPHDFLGNIAILGSPPATDPPSQLSQPAVPDGLSESTKYTQKQWKINVSMV